MIDTEIEQAAVMEKYKTGENLFNQARADVANRVITNMDKYRPTTIVDDEATGAQTEVEVSEDKINTAKQLIERAIQTGDFQSIRNRGKILLGNSADWFNNALNTAQMELARRETSIESQTGRKANNHITQGTMLQDAKGNLYQRSTLNGQAVYYKDGQPNIPLGPAEIAAIGPVTEFGKSPAEKAAIASAESYAKGTGAASVDAETKLSQAASTATTRMADNNQIRDLLGGELKTGLIQAEKDPLARQVLTGLNEGLKIGNTSVRFPIN
jgi:hypothetical protein